MANGDTPDAPLLAFYRSEHMNQNWLATLMVIGAVISSSPMGRCPAQHKRVH